MGLVFGHSWETDDEGYGEMKVSYWFESKKDPRFNGRGRTSSIIGVESIITGDIERISKQLGIEPPDDIEYGGIKD